MFGVELEHARPALLQHAIGAETNGIPGIGLDRAAIGIALLDADVLVVPFDAADEDDVTGRPVIAPTVAARLGTVRIGSRTHRHLPPPLDRFGAGQAHGRGQVGDLGVDRTLNGKVPKAGNGGGGHDAGDGHHHQHFLQREACRGLRGFHALQTSSVERKADVPVRGHCPWFAAGAFRRAARAWCP